MVRVAVSTNPGLQMCSGKHLSQQERVTSIHFAKAKEQATDGSNFHSPVTGLDSFLANKCEWLNYLSSSLRLLHLSKAEKTAHLVTVVF